MPHVTQICKCTPSPQWDSQTWLMCQDYSSASAPQDDYRELLRSFLRGEPEIYVELSPWLQSGKYSGKSAEKKLLASKWYPRLFDSVAHLRLFPLAFSPIGMGTETRYLIGPGAKLWKTGVSISSDVIGSAIGTGEIKKTHIHLVSLYIHTLSSKFYITRVTSCFYIH